MDVTAQSPRLADPRDVADLLARASDRDPLAWEELVRRYNRLVRSTVASFRLQPADAEDAVQNTWLRVIERFDTIDRERLGGWLATTASRECLALIRRKHREIPDDVAGKQLVAMEDGPDVVVVASESQRAVDTAVGELTGRRQALIQLLFYQPNCSYAEVSRVTGMPPGSIESTRSRMLRELRGTLEQRGFGPRPSACVGARLDESGLRAALDIAEDVEREPPEGGRMGSYLLDELLHRADAAFREKFGFGNGTRSHGKKLRPVWLA